MSARRGASPQTSDRSHAREAGDLHRVSPGPVLASAYVRAAGQARDLGRGHAGHPHPHRRTRGGLAAETHRDRGVVERTGLPSALRKPPFVGLWVGQRGHEGRPSRRVKASFGHPRDRCLGSDHHVCPQPTECGHPLPDRRKRGPGQPLVAHDRDSRAKTLDDAFRVGHSAGRRVGGVQPGQLRAGRRQAKAPSPRVYAEGVVSPAVDVACARGCDRGRDVVARGLGEQDVVAGAYSCRDEPADGVRAHPHPPRGNPQLPRDRASWIHIGDPGRWRLPFPGLRLILLRS